MFEAVAGCVGNQEERGIYRLNEAERADLREAEREFERGEVASESEVAETFERLRGN